MTGGRRRPPADRGDEPDEHLARAAADGDRAAMEALVRRHHESVYRLCRRMSGNDADALDATQEALITLVRRIDRFDGRSSFTTWLYRLATNACLDELRRRRRRPVPGHDDDVGRVGGAADRPSSGDDHEAIAERDELDAALRSLKVEFRAPVVLRDVLGLDYAEIAEVLDVPPGTVRSRIARGRGQLARLLDGNRTPSSQRQTVARLRPGLPSGPTEPSA